MKPIRIENGVIVYYGNRVGRVSNGNAVVDPMFEGPELNGFLEKQKSIREVKWKDGIYDQLMSGPKDTREVQVLKSCRVWQLHPDVDIRMKFIEYDELCRDFGQPDPANYQCVFDGPVDTNDLEALYTKFNIDHPSDYHGHSLSMSDVVELYNANASDVGLDSTFHYVDRFGFKEVDFEPTSPAMEMQGLSQ